MPISSSSSVIGTVVDAGCGVADASLPTGETRIARPVPPSRIPTTHYLGSVPASPYAAPARAADLSGLPSTYIATQEFDPLRDEGICYALRLMQAGVSVELHQWPGTFHGSQAVLSAVVSQRQNAEFIGALRRALAE